MVSRQMFASVCLAFMLTSHIVVTSATSWSRFRGCLRDGGLSLWDSGVVCAATKMAWAYGKMRWANCQNCDKYFHCKGNYWAVQNCSGSNAERAAEVISNCREFSQGGMDADGMADDIANRYGRSGGDCEGQYLCSANCKYSPSSGTCSSRNC